MPLQIYGLRDLKQMPATGGHVEFTEDIRRPVIREGFSR